MGPGSQEMSTGDADASCLEDSTMKEAIVADGAARLRRSPEYKARRRELQASIQARHADELSQAGVLRRLVIRWRMAAEFRRERRALEPSRGSLYGSRIVAP